MATLVGAGIAAGATALSQAGQAVATSTKNKKQRRYADKDYSRRLLHQRAQADRDNWYNSPAQQMKRFKEAGLNPNLIYGQGGGGNASSGGAGSVSTQAPNFEALDVKDAGQQIFAGYANVLQQRLQNKLVNAQIGQTNAATQKILGDVDTSSYNLEQLKKNEHNLSLLLQDSVQQSTNRTESQWLANDIARDKNNEWRDDKKHRAIMQSKEVQKATAEIKALNDQAALKDFDVWIANKIKIGTKITDEVLQEGINIIKSQYK